MITCLILRPAEDGHSSVAIVTCRQTDKINDPKSLRKALIAAVTDWMTETQQGREALVESCDSFNIGDLEMYVDGITDLNHDKIPPDESIQTYLHKYGLYDLHINVQVGLEGWDFDDHLFDAGQIALADQDRLENETSR